LSGYWHGGSIPQIIPRTAGMVSHRIQGDQRKRVSIAIELLRRPGLLLLDEPTSGLDPAMQARLMEILRQLALRGVTIICTTHTLETLHFFDKALVLGLAGGVGTLAYDGIPNRLLPSFSVNNFADLFDRLLTLEGPARMKTPGDGPETSSATGGVQFQLGRRQAKTVTPKTAETLKMVIGRTLRGIWRDPMMRVLSVVQPAVLAVLVAVSQCGATSPNPFCLFAAVSCVWLGMTLSVRELVRERPLYARDRLAGMAPSTYLTGKIVTALLVTFLQTMLFCICIVLVAPRVMGNEIVANAIVDAPKTLLFGILWLLAIAGTMQGFIVSMLANSERTAVAAIPLILLPQIVFSRAAAGDGGVQVNAASAYAPLFHASLSNLPGVTEKVLAVISLPLPTRPGSMSLELAAKSAGSALVLEVSHLIVLVAASVIVAQWLFSWRERRWLSIR